MFDTSLPLLVPLTDPTLVGLSAAKTLVRGPGATELSIGYPHTVLVLLRLTAITRVNGGALALHAPRTVGPHYVGLLGPGPGFTDRLMGVV